MVRPFVVLSVLAAGVLALMIGPETSSASPHHHHRARVGADRMPFVFHYANLPARARGTVSFTDSVRSIEAHRALLSSPETLKSFRAHQRGFTIAAADNAPLSADITVAAGPAAGATDLVGHATVPKGAKLTVSVGDGTPEEIRGAFSIPLTTLGDSDTPAVPSPLVDDVDTMAREGGHWGIQIGTTFYPNLSPGGDATQALFLDRLTLQPVGDKNWYTDGTDNPAVGIGALHAHVASLPKSEVVILAQPPTGHVPVEPGSQVRLDDWNHTLESLGASDFAQDQVTQAGDSFSVIGVPQTEHGSAWQTATSTIANPAALKGSFMRTLPDPSYYAFNPQQIPFDTSSGSSDTTNTISIGDPASGSTYTGSTDWGGFQVVLLDGATLAPRDSMVFSTNGPGEAEHLRAMHAFLTGAAQAHDLAFVRSIGIPAHIDETQRPEWNLVAKDLVALGGTLPLVAESGLEKVDPAHPYTLIGGAGLGPDAVTETTSAFCEISTTSLCPATDQPPVTRLRGYLTIDHAGRYSAHFATPTANTNSTDLYNVIHQEATPWPLTQIGPDQQAYQAAMAYITGSLGFTDPKYDGDIRNAYFLDDEFDFTTKKDALAALPYPLGEACGQPPCPQPNFTRQQFDDLKTELGNEFDMVKEVKDLFDTWQLPWDSAEAKELVDVQQIGDDIKKDLNPPAEQSLTVELFTSILGGLAETIAPGLNEGAEAVIDLSVSALDIASAVAQDSSGSALPDQVTTKVDDLSQTIADSVIDNADALAVLRKVVVSDYGKLQTMADNSEQTSWGGDSSDVATVRPSLVAGAGRMFYADLMPLAYWYGVLGLGPDEVCPTDPIIVKFTKGWPPSRWRCMWVGIDEKTGRPIHQMWFLQQSHGYELLAPATLTDALVTPIGEKTHEPDPNDDRDGVGFVLQQFMAKYLKPHCTFVADCVPLTAPAPPGAAPPRSGADVPVISGAHQSHRRWRAGNTPTPTGKAKRRRPPIGTVFSFTLNKRARVTLTFTHTATGRKVNGSCRPPTPRNRRHNACERTITAGKISLRGHPGRNRIPFHGRLSPAHKLPPGRYTLTIVAHTSNKSSKPAKLKFTITPNRDAPAHAA